jgi:4-hydroxybenzoyl-CoA thioesterase
MFERQEKVLFKHCDPAGIVFFPRYFEMINDLVETFFDVAIGVPFETLLKTNGVPTASIETKFLRPSCHGDRLDLQLVITKIGRSSISYRLTALCGEERRFETTASLVYTDASGKPQRLPDEMRSKLQNYEVSDAP